MKREKSWFIIGLLLTACIMTGIIFVYDLAPHSDTNSTIYREIRAYQHLPNGNTNIYYKGGAIEIEGTWFFNLDSNYEFYREENSTVWHVDPY